MTRPLTALSLGAIGGLALFWAVGLAWLRGCPLIDRDQLVHF